MEKSFSVVFDRQPSVVEVKKHDKRTFFHRKSHWILCLSTILFTCVFICTFNAKDHHLIHLLKIDLKAIEINQSNFSLAFLNQSNWFQLTQDQLACAERPRNEFFTSTDKVSSSTCDRPLLAIIYVLSSIDHFQRRQAIRTSWASELNSLGQLRFVVGWPHHQNDSQQLRREMQLFNDLLVYPFQDDYRMLSLKTLALLRHSQRHCSHVPFTIKCDDDVLINWPLLSKQLLQSYIVPPVTNNNSSSHLADNQLLCFRLQQKQPVRNSNDVWYVPMHVYSYNTYPDYCNGPAYVLGNASVQNLLQTLPHSEPVLFLEDVYFTGVLRKSSQIQIQSINRFMNLDPDLDSCLMRSYFVHHSFTDPEKMIQSWSAMREADLYCPPMMTM